jgi:predicted metal-dependent peptidase
MPVLPYGLPITRTHKERTVDTTIENVGTAEEIKYTAFDLNTEIFQMLSDEPFWASFSREVDKTPSTAIPTAAIRINPHTIQYEMFYNPQWFASLSWKERVDIVKHEYFHAILQHLDGSRFPKTDDADEHKLRNIAMDLAINSHLSNLPIGACICSNCGTRQNNSKICSVTWKAWMYMTSLMMIASQKA